MAITTKSETYFKMSTCFDSTRIESEIDKRPRHFAHFGVYGSMATDNPAVYAKLSSNSLYTNDSQSVLRRNTYLFPLLRSSSLMSSISSVVTWIPLRAGHNDNTVKHRVGPYLGVCLLKLRNVVKFTDVIRDLEKSSLSPRVLLHLNWHLLSRQNSKLKFAQLVWSTFTFILKVKILHNFNSGLNASNRPNR